MEKLKTKTIAAIAAGVVALTGVGVGLGVTQPWKQDEEPDEPPAQTQNEPQEPPAGQPGHFLTVGGKQLPSLLYEGDGWSILYPETWEVSGSSGSGVTFLPEGAAKRDLSLQVAKDTAASGPQMVSCYRDGETTSRLFYTGDSGQPYAITCTAPTEEWEDYMRLFAASARSFTRNGEQLFAKWSPLPEEPQWQETEGVTVLWMDKDGFALDGDAQKAVEAEMLSWDRDYQAGFTGQYRIDDFDWRASYTNLDCAPYVDVFEAQVWYQLSESGKDAAQASGGQAVVNGWLSDTNRSLLLAVLHDGSSVKTTSVSWKDGAAPGLPEFAKQLNTP